MGVYKEYFVIIIKTLLQVKNYIDDISHKSLNMRSCMFLIHRFKNINISGALYFTR